MEYIDALTTLPRLEQLKLSLYCSNAHLCQLYSDLARMKTADYLETSRKVDNWFANSPGLCMFFSFITMGMINPDNWKQITSRSDAERAREVLGYVTAVYRTPIARKPLARCARWKNGCGTAT
jgi:hypothetical protein